MKWKPPPLSLLLQNRWQGSQIKTGNSSRKMVVHPIPFFTEGREGRGPLVCEVRGKFGPSSPHEASCHLTDLHYRGLGEWGALKLNPATAKGAT